MQAIKLSRIRLRLFLVLMLGATSIALTGPSGLGEIDFPTSASEAAQHHFIKGVLLLHSFEYEDARLAFLDAQAADKDFAMAYWGEAMTHNHPIWNSTSPEEAREVLNRLAATARERRDKAPTEREKDYLAAVEILYGDGTKPERDRKYSDAMRALSDRFPQDDEARCFYALSVLGTAQAKRDFRIYMRAGAIALQVFQRNPQHPGAAHYVVHSFDDPIHAPLGLEAARVYADIAPDAPHALHMPSHIFMALGMWDASNKTNVASAAASMKKGQHNHHAIWWLTYGYLQAGQFRNAAEQLKQLETVMTGHASQRTGTHLAYMGAAYMVDTDFINGDYFSAGIDAADYSMGSAANIYLARGLFALKQGKPAVARELLTALQSLDPETSRYSDEEVSALIRLELTAAIAQHDGDHAAALAAMDEAVAKLRAMSYEFGPTDPVKPVHELYGDILIAMNKPAEAAKQYRDALSYDPLRLRSLAGLARALDSDGQFAEAAKVYKELAEVLHAADDDVLLKIEAEQYSGQASSK